MNKHKLLIQSLIKQGVISLGIVLVFVGLYFATDMWATSTDKE